MWKDLERSGEWKRREGKRGERKDPQEAILILKKFCTCQTPNHPPLAAILVIMIRRIIIRMIIIIVIIIN